MKLVISVVLHKHNEAVIFTFDVELLQAHLTTYMLVLSVGLSKFVFGVTFTAYLSCYQVI